MKTPLRALWFGFIGMWVAGESSAQTTLRFEGQVDSRGANLASFFTVGDSYTFDVTFDPEIAPVNTFDGYSYLGTDARLQIAATGGSVRVDVTAPRFLIRNDYSGYDEYTISFSYPGTTTYNYVSGFAGTLPVGPTLRLFDGTANALDSSVLPDAITRSAWSAIGSQSNIALYFNSGTSADFLRLAINNVGPVSAVPEPSSVGLLAGMAGLAWTIGGRRRRR